MEINKVICGDSLEYMKTLPDKCIDLVLTDPPYGINADKNAVKNWEKCRANWFRVYENVWNWDESIPHKEYFKEIFRISKNQIIWGGNYFVEYLKNSQYWLFWDKWQRDFSFADWELARTSFDKAVRAFNYSRWAFLSENWKHPTQKPKELFKWCLDNYSKPWDVILDCFAWSWTTAVACIETWRNYIVIEKEPKYVEIIENRIKNTTLPLFVI